MSGLRCPVVHDITIVRCRWCGGVIDRYVSDIRQKTSSYDLRDMYTRHDYHEECWCEAIEIQI